MLTGREGGECDGYSGRGVVAGTDIALRGEVVKRLSTCALLFIPLPNGNARALLCKAHRDAVTSL